VYLVCCLSLFTFILSALDVKWSISLGGVVVIRDFLEAYDLVGPTKTTVPSTVVTIYSIGCFFRAIFAFTIGERLGCKNSII
jgi:hypothetical protein